MEPRFASPRHCRALTKSDKRRPREASLRRAVSTAYYAVFQALCRTCATKLGDRALGRVHADISVFGSSVSLRWRSGTPIGRQARLAEAIESLQAAREWADYNPEPRPKFDAATNRAPFVRASARTNGARFVAASNFGRGSGLKSAHSRAACRDLRLPQAGPVGQLAVPERQRNATMIQRPKYRREHVPRRAIPTNWWRRFYKEPGKRRNRLSRLLGAVTLRGDAVCRILLAPAHCRGDAKRGSTCRPLCGRSFAVGGFILGGRERSRKESENPRYLAALSRRRRSCQAGGSPKCSFAPPSNKCSRIGQDPHLDLHSFPTQFCRWRPQKAPLSLFSHRFGSPVFACR